MVDLGERRFLVDSESQDNEDWYLLDLLSGFCSCLVGKTCKPCKHKATAAKFSGKAYFSVTEKKTTVKSEILLQIDEIVMEFEDKSVTAEDSNENIEGQEFDADLVAGQFSEAMRAYTEMILKHHSENKQGPAKNRGQ